MEDPNGSKTLKQKRLLQFCLEYFPSFCQAEKNFLLKEEEDLKNGIFLPSNLLLPGQVFFFTKRKTNSF
jgi:hypothetical protein